MSDFLSDIGNMYGPREVGNHTVNIVKKGSNLDLDMTDFITLMITQMTNQGIDDTMDTSEMLNQMVQMQMIQSMVNMTDATTMNYAGNLFDKYVTVGKWTADGLEEIYGRVEAVGTMNGQPVIFVNGEYYYLNEIMAIGKLPETKETEKDGEDGDSEETEGSDKVEGSDSAEDENKTEGTDNPNGPDETGETDQNESEYDGSSGADTNDVG